MTSERQLFSNARYYAENRDKVRLMRAAYHAKNREALNKKNRKWNAENKDRRAAYLAENAERDSKVKSAWYKNNKTKENSRNSKWHKNNRARVNSLKSLRRANQRAACPKWADLEKIEAIYVRAKRLSEESGTMYCVDHIVPLKHKLVCGLHVPYNLRVITFSENAKKKNKLIQELAWQLPQQQTLLDLP